MEYRITQCDIYGIKKPFLILDGWIESCIEEIKLVSKYEVLFSIKFEKTKSKIHTFSVRTALNKCRLIENCKLIAYKETEQIELKSFRTTPVSRFLEKMNARNSFDDLDISEFKELFDSTLKINKIQNYNYWITNYESFNPVQPYEYNPLISIVIPVYNVDRVYLSKCINSVLNQSYQNFQICIADDCSTNIETRSTLQEYANLDKRIKVLFRKSNGHISAATNSALSLADGEFVGLMDNDDELAPQALNEIVKVLNEKRDLDFIYTDEDKIDLHGNRSDPQFKPDFTLEKLYGGNYICHFNVIRKSIIDDIGGFRKGFEGAQDFDLFLRITEVTDKFYHIPKILYHWRMIPGSTALDSGSKNYAGLAGKRALDDYFEKKGINVQVDIMVHTHYYVEYILKKEPSIDILIHVQNNIEEFIEVCKRLPQKLSYKNYSIIVITENPEELESRLSQIFMCNLNARIYKTKKNFLYTINDIIKATKSEYILFLDEYAEIETFNALEQMVGQALQENIGAVGCKVLNHQNLVTESGFYLTRRKLIPLYYLAYRDDYGIYGTLLVPNAFRLIETKCFLLKTNLIKEMKYFDSNLSIENSYFDMFLRLDQKKYVNVVLPRIEVYSNRESVIEKDDSELQSLIAKWSLNEYDTYYDHYYNINVSDKLSYRFDK